MPIKGFSNTERLPRLGKLRLGYIDESGPRSFPRATDWFVVPDAVAEVYGQRPTIIEPVLLPGENDDQFASLYYRYYTTTFGLTCKGDGETASRLVDLDIFDETREPVPASSNTRQSDRRNDPVTARMDVECPCPLLETRQCRPILMLQIVLPQVKGIGIWQIDTQSVNSIRNVESCLHMLRFSAGRFTGIPLRLSLVPMKVTPRGQSAKTVRVLDLQVSTEYSPAALGAFAKGLPEHAPVALPVADDERPEEITPSIDAMTVADEHEASETSQAEDPESPDGPDEMTREQFEAAAESEGFSPEWIIEAVLNVPVSQADSPTFDFIFRWWDEKVRRSPHDLWKKCLTVAEHKGMSQGVLVEEL